VKISHMCANTQWDMSVSVMAVSQMSVRHVWVCHGTRDHNPTPNSTARSRSGSFVHLSNLAWDHPVQISKSATSTACSRIWRGMAWRGHAVEVALLLIRTGCFKLQVSFRKRATKFECAQSTQIYLCPPLERATENTVRGRTRWLSQSHMTYMWLTQPRVLWHN